MPTLKPIIKKFLLVALVAFMIAAPVVSFGASSEDGKSADNCGSLIFDPLCNLNKVFNEISIQISYLISYVAAFLVTIASSIIQMLINLGSQVISNPLVTTGFKITLDIANLGFVLAIIVLAYATMFRISGYEMKTFLRNLVFAALLVNFSFIIAGTIIDATNVFGNFFLNAASPGDVGKFADNLANSLNVQKLLNIVPNPADSAAGSFLKFGASYLTMFASVATTAIFSVFMVITFFAIAFMLLVRYIYIIFLLILMPLAWLAWVFPGYSHLFKKWWDNFLQWNLFYPAVTLFLYLGIESSQQIGQLVQNSTKGGAIDAATKMSSLGAATIVTFIQIFVQIALMLGGLFVANALKITGASVAMGWASGARKWITGAAGRATGLPAAYRGAKGVGGPTGGAIANRLLQKGGLAEKTAGVLSKVPLMRGTAAGLYNAVAARQALVAERQKEEFGKDSNEAILTKFNAFTTDKVRKAALANEIAKRGLSEHQQVVKKDKDGNIVDDSRLTEYLTSAKELDATKDILSSAPQLAPKILTEQDLIKKGITIGAGEKLEDKAIEFAMAGFRPGKTEELSPSAIEKVAKYFGQAHRERIAKEGDSIQLLAIAKAAAKLSANQPEHPLVQFSINNPAMQQAAFSPDFKAVISKIKSVAAETEQKPKVILTGSEISGKKPPGTPPVGLGGPK